MKLSEAIRRGADWPDIHGPYTAQDGVACCALGGVGKAIDLREPFYSWHLEKAFPLLSEVVRHPMETYDTKLINIVVNLFESRGWSKPAISEWVETVERKLGLWDEPKADSPVVVEAVKASLIPVVMK